MAGARWLRGGAALKRERREPLPVDHWHKNTIYSMLFKNNGAEKRGGGLPRGMDPALVWGAKREAAASFWRKAEFCAEFAGRSGLRESVVPLRFTAQF